MTELEHVCVDRILPRDLFRPIVTTGTRKPRAIAVAKSLWPNGSTLKVIFMEGGQKDCDFVKSTAIEWLQYANLHFEL